MHALDVRNTPLYRVSNYLNVLYYGIYIGILNLSGYIPKVCMEYTHVFLVSVLSFS